MFACTSEPSRTSRTGVHLTLAGAHRPALLCTPSSRCRSRCSSWPVSTRSALSGMPLPVLPGRAHACMHARHLCMHAPNTLFYTLHPGPRQPAQHRQAPLPALPGRAHACMHAPHMCMHAPVTLFYTLHPGPHQSHQHCQACPSLCCLVEHMRACMHPTLCACMHPIPFVYPSCRDSCLGIRQNLYHQGELATHCKGFAGALAATSMYKVFCCACLICSHTNLQSMRCHQLLVICLRQGLCPRVCHGLWRVLLCCDHADEYGSS